VEAQVEETADAATVPTVNKMPGNSGTLQQTRTKR